MGLRERAAANWQNPVDQALAIVAAGIFLIRGTPEITQWLTSWRRISSLNV